MKIDIQLSGVYTFALFLTFLVLKLTGHIAWSWWWVTCPLWAVFVPVVVLGLIFVVIWLMANWRTI